MSIDTHDAHFLDASNVNTLVCSHMADNQIMPFAPTIDECYEEDRRKVFIGGLSSVTKESDLFHFFKQFGFIRHVSIIRDFNTGISRGFGFCDFYNDNALDLIRAAQEKRPLFVRGRLVTIRPYMNKRARMAMFVANMLQYGPHPLLLPQLPLWPYPEFGMCIVPDGSQTVSTPICFSPTTLSTTEN